MVFQAYIQTNVIRDNLLIDPGIDYIHGVNNMGSSVILRESAGGAFRNILDLSTSVLKLGGIQTEHSTLQELVGSYRVDNGLFGPFNPTVSQHYYDSLPTLFELERISKVPLLFGWVNLVEDGRKVRDGPLASQEALSFERFAMMYADFVESSQTGKPFMEGSYFSHIQRNMQVREELEEEGIPKLQRKFKTRKIISESEMLRLYGAHFMGLIA